jgi:predicted O-linked N-acetylglucosamine transferase (SPINDLY family)
VTVRERILDQQMPPDLSAKFALVSQHLNAGRHEQARQVLMRVLQLAPTSPEANNGMAIALTNMGQHEQGAFYARRAVQLAPNDPNNLNTLGSCLSHSGKQDEAIEVLTRAISLSPADVVPRATLSNTLWAAHRCTESVERLREGLALLPFHPELVYRIAPKLALLIRAREAYDLAAASSQRFPKSHEPAWAMATSSLYCEDLSPEEVRDAHRRHAEVIAKTSPASAPVFASTRDPNRKLRIAFLSGDLRAHSVSYFLEPLLEGLDREQFHITCYSNSAQADEVTKRLKALTQEWRQVEGLSDADLRARIVLDRTDVLIDLSGYSIGHRLSVFHLRAAPVQVTYCGYACTTAIPAMDFRIVDRITDTAEADAWATERLVRLEPPFLCYRPFAGAPEVGTPPSQRVKSGAAPPPIRFGSFNATSKLNGRVIALWSRVLESVPNSRLVLKGLQLKDDGFRREVEARFKKHGITPDRLTLHGQKDSIADHLATYHDIDIALDPFPYHGTTTTCEALWMGVPVVTLAGRVHAQRVGVTLLHAAGLDDLVAATEDQYVEIARGLATSPDRLTELRSGLRGRLASSSLMDKAGYAARFGEALRQCWRLWCERPQ